MAALDKTAHLDCLDPEIETVTDVPCVSRERREIEAEEDSHIRPTRTAIIVALFCTWIIWGSTYLGMRIAMEGFPPFLMGGIRFVVAGAVLYALLRGRGSRNPSGAQWGGAALVGILLLAGGNGGVIYAEQWVASGLAALGVATAPLWAAVFSGLWGQWPTKQEWLGLGVGFAGMVLLNSGEELRANPAGLVALLLSAVCWAFGSVWSRRLPMPGGMMASAAQMLTGGAALLAMAAVHGEHLNHLPGLRPLLAMGYLIVGGIVAFSAYVYLLKRVRPALATSNSYVNPVIAVGLGALLAGEHLTAVEGGALVLILAGVGLLAAVKQET